MRRLLSVLLLAIALPVAAQNSPPPKLEPLPEPPPPPPGTPADDEMEPKVTIVKRGNDTHQEYRVKGRLYMVKVTPQRGKPYYLLDRRGDGEFSRMESLDTGLRVPQWVLKEW